MLVKVDRECFIGGSIRKAGEVVEYDGPLSSWMVPVGPAQVEEEPAPAPVSKKRTRIVYAEHSDLPAIVEE